jgi:replicative DNA helicase
MTDLEEKILSSALQGFGLTRTLKIPLQAWSCPTGEKIAKALRDAFVAGELHGDSPSVDDSVHLKVYDRLKSTDITLAFIESLALGNASIAGSDAYIEQLVDMLLSDSAHRTVIQTVKDAVEAAKHAPNAADAKSEALGLLLQLEEGGDDSDNLRSLGDCLEEVITGSEAAFARPDEEKCRPVGVVTGFTNLDQLMAGFRRGSVVVIGAGTGQGKTVLATNMATGIAREGCGTVLYVSLEMPGTDIARRALGGAAKLSATIIENGLYDSRQIESLVAGNRRLAEIGEKVFLYDKAGLNLTRLATLVHRVHKEHEDLCAIFVDYIQLLRVPETYSREREVATISAALVEIARQHNVVVFPLSQLNDSGRTRESKAVEHDSSGFLVIEYAPEGHEHAWKPGRGDVPCRIVVRKNRHGQTGYVDATFKRAHHMFTFGTPDGWNQ